MLHTIEFGTLSAMLIDFVDSTDGFLFLRMAGPEPAVNAIWAYLVSREARGKKWGSATSIPLPGHSHQQYVAAQKHVTYRTLRTRLPNGMVDLALVHPILTVAEDSEQGFYLLTYETDGVPLGFVERLNASLSIPLKPEWQDWLWTDGQQQQTFFAIETKSEYQGGQPVEVPRLVEANHTPISLVDSLGQVHCYGVHCAGRFRDAWLQIIRDQLDLAIPLQCQAGKGQRYSNGRWVIFSEGQEWRLTQDDESVLVAPTLNFLLTQANKDLGLPFRIQEAGR